MSIEDEHQTSIDDIAVEWLNATGDVVRGDIIRFSEAVFGGSHRNPKYMGDRTITAEVVRDSYGRDKQQHTFTLSVISAQGEDAQDILDQQTAHGYIMRKGRNIYRNGVQRKVWADESARRIAADEKHERGDVARWQREARRGLAL